MDPTDLQYDLSQKECNVVLLYVMNAYMGVEVQLHSFLTSALSGNHLVHDNHWEAGCVGSRAGLDTLEKGNPTEPAGILFHYE